MPPEEFQKLPETERERIQRDIEELQGRLQQTVLKLPEWERERRQRVRDLNRELTVAVVANLVGQLKAAYADLPDISQHVEAMQKDIAENVEAFLPQAEPPTPAVRPPAEAAPHHLDGRRPAPLRRYLVNVMVSSDGSLSGAPCVIEDLPTQANLVGRVEHLAEMGALVTDFALIRPGALHRANGGYLIVDSLKLLQSPMSWESLKRALRAQRIHIESAAQMLSLISTVSLEPEPIPLAVKVALIGDRQLYYLLSAYDPEFADLFKVEVDLAEDTKRTPESVKDYAQLIATIVRRNQLKPFARDAVARVVEHAARLAGDSGRITVQVGILGDLLREADYWARNGRVGAGDVERAIRAQRRRSDRIAERMQDMVLEETVMVDTDGAKVGQINGLAVYGLGNVAFGRPSRITARVRLGSGEVIDIERRVELGGPLHSKGVLILSGFLAARYAADRPLSLSATLVFEQSYSGVDGDSASSTELYALLSALSGLPIGQNFAVTGSVNQMGEVQAIGGVNEKIEGFFDLCQARGLNGRQGVLIPVANVRHLMLKPEVVEAVAAGRFRVFPIASIDQGIEVLTGVPAGTPQADDQFPPGSVNRMVQDRLNELTEQRRRFGAALRPDEAPSQPDKEARP